MSAQVVQIRDPVLQAIDLAEHIHELAGSIPDADAHIDYVDEDGVAVIGDWEGASPGGYRYAPGSEAELREALELLWRADRLLQGVLSREYSRSGNEVDD